MDQWRRHSSGLDLVLDNGDILPGNVGHSGHVYAVCAQVTRPSIIINIQAPERRRTSKEKQRHELGSRSRLG